jgi:hypothetical protein
LKFQPSRSRGVLPDLMTRKIFIAQSGANLYKRTAMERAPKPADGPLPRRPDFSLLFEILMIVATRPDDEPYPPLLNLLGRGCSTAHRVPHFVPFLPFRSVPALCSLCALLARPLAPLPKSRRRKRDDFERKQNFVSSQPFSASNFQQSDWYDRTKFRPAPSPIRVISADS